jgi:hypothetical protein
MLMDCHTICTTISTEAYPFADERATKFKDEMYITI